MIRFVKQAFLDFVELIYPNLCRCCFENAVERNKNYFCITCHSKFPYTKDIGKLDNDLMYHFYGRVPIERATSLLWYSEGGVVQKLIHNMKYKDMKEIGVQLGAMLGKNILDSGFYRNIDLCLSVPMHYKKQTKRGFNQAELIAESISFETHIPFAKNILVKEIETETQTSKTRKERALNASNIYSVVDRSLIENKHVLIVDDVVTTGSTLEACAIVLLRNGASKVSVACLAMGNRHF